MTVYFISGLVWGGFLEYYTTNFLFGPMGQKWLWRERFFHVLLWPLSLGIFLYNFFKGLW